jgi:hypothetical protein
MPIDDSIPSETTSTYSNDFIGANLPQRGDGNQFVDETHIIPLIACAITLFRASISSASQQPVTDGLD